MFSIVGALVSFLFTVIVADTSFVSVLSSTVLVTVTVTMMFLDVSPSCQSVITGVPVIILSFSSNFNPFGNSPFIATVELGLFGTTWIASIA